MEKMEHVANTGDRRDAALKKRRQKSKSNCRWGEGNVVGWAQGIVES